MSRRVRVGLGTIVSAVVLAALLWFTDPAQIWDTLSAADMRWIAAATLVNIATIPVMAWRWKLLLRAKKIPVPMGWLIRTYFVALFLGQFLPAAIGGDAVRAVELARRTHAAPEAVASVLIDRLVGVVSLVALAVLAYAAGGGSSGRPEVAVAEAMFGLAALAILGLLFSAGCAGWRLATSSRGCPGASWRPGSGSTTRCTSTATTGRRWAPSAGWRWASRWCGCRRSGCSCRRWGWRCRCRRSSRLGRCCSRP